jgi:hypothetical protein
MKQTELAIYVFIIVFIIYLMMNSGMGMIHEGMTSTGCVDKDCPDGCSKPTRQSGNCREDGVVKDKSGKCYIRHKCPWECHDTFDKCKYDKCCEGCNPPVYFYVPTSCDNHEESDLQHLNDVIPEKDIKNPNSKRTFSPKIERIRDAMEAAVQAGNEQRAKELRKQYESALGNENGSHSGSSTPSQLSGSSSSQPSGSPEPSPAPSQPSSNSPSSQPSEFNPSNNSMQNNAGPRGYYDAIHF